MGFISDLFELLTNPALYLSCYMILGLYCSLPLLVCTPHPVNYAAFLVPWVPAFIAFGREQQRQTRLGLTHDRLREIPEEQMTQALEYFEKQRKKLRGSRAPTPPLFLRRT
jgi:hypothetical protein